MHSHCLLDPAFPSDRRIDMESTILGLLQFYIALPTLFESVSSTPGYIGVLLSIWVLKQKDSIYRDIDEETKMCLAMERSVEGFAGNLSNKKPSKEDVAITEGIQQDLKKVATTVTDMTKADLAQKPVVYELVSVDIRTLGMLVKLSPLDDDLYRYSQVAAFLGRILGDRIPSVVPTNAIDAITACIDYIDLIFLSASDCWKVMTVILENGILPSLLKANAWLSKHSPNQRSPALKQIKLTGKTAAMLSGIFPKWLIYRSCLRLVSKSLKEISKLHLEETLSEGEVHSAFRQFKKLVEQRSQIKTSSDAHGKIACGGVC